MSDFDYTDKRVVVTGGATGVGAALLELLAELGATDVTVLDVKAPSGPHARFLPTDLSQPVATDEAIAQLEDPIDALFNNAGVADTLPSDVVFRVNALAVRQLSQALLPRMRTGGAIVNTASIAGMQWASHLELINEFLDTDGWDAGLEWFAEHEVPGDTYAFTKEIVQVWTLRSSRAAAAHGVRVNSVCPAPIDTPLLVDFKKTMTDKIIDWTVDQAGGRLVTAREVASCLAWLGSPASSFVSGVNLNVDGGFTAAMTTGQLDYSKML